MMVKICNSKDVWENIFERHFKNYFSYKKFVDSDGWKFLCYRVLTLNQFDPNLRMLFCDEQIFESISSDEEGTGKTLNSAKQLWKIERIFLVFSCVPENIESSHESFEWILRDRWWQWRSRHQFWQRLRSSNLWSSRFATKHFDNFIHLIADVVSSQEFVSNKSVDCTISFRMFCSWNVSIRCSERNRSNVGETLQLQFHPRVLAETSSKFSPQICQKLQWRCWSKPAESKFINFPFLSKLFSLQSFLPGNKTQKFALRYRLN